MEVEDPISRLFSSQAGSGRPVLALAPMAGVTDAPFRALCRRYGAVYAISEMAASQAMIRHTAKSALIASGLDKEPLTAAQIAGSDPEVMARAARICVDNGAEIIDINMGCPVKKIVRNGSGAALLRDEGRLTAIIRRVVAEVAPHPVTLKIRIGWDHQSRNGIRVAGLAESLGIRCLTVHGRTRSQMYRGKADWDYIGRIKRMLSIPVIGNGDVFSPDDAARMLETTGVDGIMIGRAAMGRPWIFQQIAHFLSSGQRRPDPFWPERAALAREHLLALLDFYGPEVGNRLARKHLAWHVRGVRGSARFRAGINQSESPEETLEMVDGFFATFGKQCHVA